MTLKRFPQKARTLFGTLAIVIFHGRVYFVTILLGFTFLASPLRIVSEHALADSPPYVPPQVIRLQAPWVSGVRYPQSYEGHGESSGYLGAVDFYSAREPDDSVGDWPVTATHSGVAYFQPNGCGGNRRVIVTDETLGIKTYYSHVRFPSGYSGGDYKPVSAGEIIGYARDWGELDDCQNWPHLMFRVELRTASGWREVNLRYVELDGQRVFDDPWESGSWWRDDPITSYQRGFSRKDDAYGPALAASPKTATAYLGKVVSTSARRFATVAAGADGLLRLDVWDVSLEGTVQSKESRGTGIFGAVGSIAVAASGPDISTSVSYSLVAAAIRSGSGNLTLITWKVDAAGNATLKDYETLSVPISKVSMVRTLGYSPTTRLVTAARTTSGDLRLDVWDVSYADGTITWRTSHTAGWTITDVAVTSQRGYVVTAVCKFLYNVIINGVSRPVYGLAVTTWKLLTVSSGISIEERDDRVGGGALADINISRAWSSFVVVAGIDDDPGYEGSLWLKTYSVATDGTLALEDSHVEWETLASGARGLDISEVALVTDDGMALTAVRLINPVDVGYDSNGGHLKLIKWWIYSDGRIERGRDAMAGTADPLNTSVASFGWSTNRFVTTVRTGNGYLKVIAWHNVY